MVPCTLSLVPYAFGFLRQKLLRTYSRGIPKLYQPYPTRDGFFDALKIGKEFGAEIESFSFTET